MYPIPPREAFLSATLRTDVSVAATNAVTLQGVSDIFVVHIKFPFFFILLFFLVHLFFPSPASPSRGGAVSIIAHDRKLIRGVNPVRSQEIQILFAVKGNCFSPEKSD